MDQYQSNIKSGAVAAFFCALWAIAVSFKYGFSYESVAFIAGYTFLGVTLKNTNIVLGVSAILISIVFSLSHLAMFHPIPVLIFFITLMFYFIRYTIAARGIAKFHESNA